jgi:predicted nucleic acid-binding Zn ribbon protein
VSENRATTKPQRLGEILDHVLREQGLEARIRQHRILAYWDEFVGKEIARRAKAVAIERGTLFVVVDNAIWMQELHMLKEQIRDTINKKLGSDEVKKIHFQLG